MIKTILHHYVIDKFVTSVMDNLLSVFHPEPVSKMNFDLGEYFTSVTDIDNNLIFYDCLIIANTTDGIFDGEYFYVGSVIKQLIMWILVIQQKNGFMKMIIIILGMFVLNI